MIFPFIKSKRAEHELAPDQRALLIVDVFKTQTTQKVLDLIEKDFCEVVFVPANMTHNFNPLDLTVNGPAKKFLMMKFEDWSAKEIAQQINAGVDVYSIEIKTALSVLKPVQQGDWVACMTMRNQADVIKKGFEMAGINEAISSDLEPEDLFSRPWYRYSWIKCEVNIITKLFTA